MPLTGLVMVLAVSAVPGEEGRARSSIDGVIASLERTEAAIHNLSVETEYVKLQKFALPVAVPVRLRFATKFLVDRSGRSRYECVGEQVNVGPGPGEMRTYRGRWLAAYDLEAATSLVGGADGAFHSGTIDRHPSWHGVNPLEYTTHYFGEPIGAILRRKGACVAGQQEWESLPVAVVETEPVTVDGKGWKQQFLVDAERGVAVRRAALVLRSPEQGWREYTRIESRGHEEVSRGIWLPLRFTYESVSTPEGGGPEQLAWRFEGRNSGWAVNRELPEGAFRLEIPEGVTVTDHREAQPEGHK